MGKMCIKYFSTRNCNYDIQLRIQVATNLTHYIYTWIFRNKRLTNIDLRI